MLIGLSFIAYLSLSYYYSHGNKRVIYMRSMLIITILSYTIGFVSPSQATTFQSHSPKIEYHELCYLNAPGSDPELVTNFNSVPCVSKTKGDETIYQFSGKTVSFKPTGPKRGSYTRVKFNGKPALLIEKDRDTFELITDDLSWEFSNATIQNAQLPASFIGKYTSEPATKETCAKDKVKITSKTMSTGLGECQISRTTKTTVEGSDIFVVFANCEGDDGPIHTTFNIAPAPDNMISFAGDLLHRCPSR